MFFAGWIDRAGETRNEAESRVGFSAPSFVPVQLHLSRRRFVTTAPSPSPAIPPGLPRIKYSVRSLINPTTSKTLTNPSHPSTTHHGPTKPHRLRYERVQARRTPQVLLGQARPVGSIVSRHRPWKLIPFTDDSSEAWRYTGPFSRWNRFKGGFPGLGIATVAFAGYCAWEHFFEKNHHHHAQAHH